MYANRMLGLKRDEIIGGWRKLLIQKLHNFYYSGNIIRMIKSMRMRFPGLVERMGRR
jgi:hypothetical protein